MTLTEYIRATKGNATALAFALGVSKSYLSQMAAGTTPVSPERAMRIEEITDGAVTRRDTRPEDCDRIWPELRNEAAA